MPVSTITSKGQTTIPLEIRKGFNLRPHDKIIYVRDGNTLVMYPVHGDIRDLKGILSKRQKGKLDFHKLREEVKKRVAKSGAKE
jgi:AbrB family looped-hinge helix DNA binding protein